MNPGALQGKRQDFIAATGCTIDEQYGGLSPARIDNLLELRSGEMQQLRRASHKKLGEIWRCSADAAAKIQDERIAFPQSIQQGADEQSPVSVTRKAPGPIIAYGLRADPHRLRASHRRVGKHDGGSQAGRLYSTASGGAIGLASKLEWQRTSLAALERRDGGIRHFTHGDELIARQ